MEQYDLIYRLYDEFDTQSLREYQEFVDLFPPVDSRVALDHWQDAHEELENRKDEIRDAFAAGETFADIAARATRDQAFTALDLYSQYGRAVNALVLDVDETLRSAGTTDNEIPRETLHLITEFHERGVPIVICTGQTLENVKGFAIQGLGNALVHSGDLSIVYETGNGVFTPGHGSDTKQLLYEELDEEIRAIFDEIRSRILPDAPEDIRRGAHLQGNEFNITLKPNHETGSERAETVIDAGMVYMMELLGEALAAHVDADDEECVAYTKSFFASADPEIRTVLEKEGERFDPDLVVPDDVEGILERLDVAYYHADAAEIGSLELDKVAGVKAALDVLDIDDPFICMMGDSKSDLRVMRWAQENDCGFGAAPQHASPDVLEYVMETDELVFDPGKSAEMFRALYVLNRLAEL